MRGVVWEQDSRDEWCEVRDMSMLWLLAGWPGMGNESWHQYSGKVSAEGVCVGGGLGVS